MGSQYANTKMLSKYSINIFFCIIRLINILKTYKTNPITINCSLNNVQYDGLSWSSLIQYQSASRCQNKNIYGFCFLYELYPGFSKYWFIENKLNS